MVIMMCLGIHIQSEKNTYMSIYLSMIFMLYEYPRFHQRATHHEIDSLASNHDNPFERFWQSHGFSRNMSPQSGDINTEIKIPLICFR